MEIQAKDNIYKPIIITLSILIPIVVTKEATAKTVRNKRGRPGS